MDDHHTAMESFFSAITERKSLMDHPKAAIKK